jgi:SP family sugar:H+ symporter-like MFS transporter
MANVRRVDPDKGNLQSKVFFIWGSFCFVCIAFVFFMVYETKNLTLEEVDELYETESKAWKSNKFVPALRFAEIEKEMAGEGRRLSYAEARDAFMRRRSTMPADSTLPPTAEANEEEAAGEKKAV